MWVDKDVIETEFENGSRRINIMISIDHSFKFSLSDNKLQ